MAITQPELWARIEAFELDERGGAVTFGAGRVAGGAAGVQQCMLSGGAGQGSS